MADCIFETPNSLTYTNKMERGASGPLVICFRNSSGLNNIFKILKGPFTACVFETPNTFSYTNKMERGFKRHMDPVRAGLGFQ